ncbi:MAG: hypothetical protein D6751_10640, partial [Deltaproteobacteria bacterium]
PTTSEAIPAFARQTGAACLSCHFQSFPTLSAFGRAFKMGALTDVGEQALVEDEALSIPAVLNATIVFRPQVNNTKVATTGLPSVTSKEISYGDQVVLIGGRIGPNAGAFVELGGGAFGNHQLFTSFDFGGFKGGINYQSSGFGSDAALQLGNTWGQHGGMMNMRVTSANQYIEGRGRATGGLFGAGQYASLAAWAGNDMGAIQLGLVAPSDGTAFGVAGNGTFKAATIVRANGFFDVGGMTAGVGGIFITGNVGSNGQYNVPASFALDPATGLVVPVPGLAVGQLEMKRWGLEASLEGEMGDSQFGLYADYASAKASSATKTNVFNPSLDKLSGWGLRGTVKPLHNLVFGLGYNSMKAGVVKDKTFHIGAEYEFYQNFVIALTYTNNKVSTPVSTTKTTTTLLDVEALL